MGHERTRLYGFTRRIGEEIVEISIGLSNKERDSIPRSVKEDGLVGVGVGGPNDASSEREEVLESEGERAFEVGKEGVKEERRVRV